MSWSWDAAGYRLGCWVSVLSLYFLQPCHKVSFCTTFFPFSAVANPTACVYIYGITILHVNVNVCRCTWIDRLPNGIFIRAYNFKVVKIRWWTGWRFREFWKGEGCFVSQVTLHPLLLLLILSIMLRTWNGNQDIRILFYK